MLRIRPEQLEHFANRARDRFVKLMTEYIAETFPEHIPGDDASAPQAWVRRALEVCERHGVTMQSDAAQLVLLLLVLGVDVEQREPWVSQALARDLAPIGKVRRLLAALRERRIVGIDEMIVFDEYREPSEGS